MSPLKLPEVLADKNQDLSSLILAISNACIGVANQVKNSALEGNLGVTGIINVQGETLDLNANDLFVKICSANPKLAAIVSEEVEEPLWLKEPEKDDFILYIDPLDGSSNLNVDLSVGSIFSITRVGSSDARCVLRSGKHQLAAGYAIYGSSTMFVVSTGRDVQGYTLCVSSGDFILTHPFMTIPKSTSEFAINTSRARFWKSPIRRYVSECTAGEAGPRGQDFNMRWTASMVADVHRILVRGGVFLYPKDTNNQSTGGKIRLLYEANPMAFIVKAAAGRASTGDEDILSISPKSLHQRTSVILGSADEVNLIESYH
jgi:fructose-1,6-bisphosphatase